MLKKGVLWVVIVVLGMSMFYGSFQVAAQSPDADVFAVIKIANPDAFIADIGMLVDKVSPGMGAMTSGMALGQLQMILQNPEWIGMDKTGEYTVVVLDPMKYTSSIAILLPITNKDEYVSTLSQTMGGGEEVEGIYSFGAEMVFGAFAGNTGVLSDDQEVTQQVKALVEANSPVLAEVPVVKGQITASVAVTKLLAAFRPMIEGFSQMMLMGMQQEMAEGEEAQPEGMPPMEQMTNVLQAEINIALALLEQTEKLQLGISVQPDEGVRIAEAVFPVAGSNLEKFFAAQTPQKSALLGVLPADSAILASGTTNYTPEFIAGYAEFMKLVAGAMAPEDVAAAEKMAQLTSDAFEAYGGDFAMSILSQDVLFAQIMSVKDAQKAKNLLKESPGSINSILEIYKSFGLELDMQLLGTEEYKGGEILTYDLGLAAEDIPDPEGQEAFRSIIGDTLAYPIGISEKYSVVGIGKNARGQVEKLMETLDSGAEVAAPVTPVTFGLPEANNFFMYLSLPRMLKWVVQFAPEVPEDLEIVEGPGIGIGTSFNESYVQAELVVPLGEILAIRDAVQQAQVLGVGMGTHIEEPEAPVQ